MGPRVRAKMSDNMGNRDHQGFSQGKDGARVDLNGLKAAMQGMLRSDWGKNLDPNDRRLRELAETLVVAGGSGDRDPARLRRQAEVLSYNAGGFAGAALGRQLFEEKSITVAQQNQRLGIEERKEDIHEDIGRRLGKMLVEMDSQEQRSSPEQHLNWAALGALQAESSHAYFSEIGFEESEGGPGKPVDYDVLAACLGEARVHSREGEGLDVSAFSQAWVKDRLEQAQEAQESGLNPMALGEVNPHDLQVEGERIAMAINKGILNGRVKDIAACGGHPPSPGIQIQMQEHAELLSLDPQKGADRNRINVLILPVGGAEAVLARAQDTLNRLQVYWNTAGVMPRKGVRAGWEIGVGTLKVGWAGVETGAGVAMAAWALLHGWSEMATSMGKDLASGKGPSGNFTTEALWGLGGFRAIKSGVTDGAGGVKQGLTSVSTASQAVDGKVDRVRTRSQAALNALQSGMDNAQRNAREGLENHQLYCNQARKLFEAAVCVATAPDEDTRAQARVRMKGIKAEMVSLLEAMKTDTPSIAWSLDSHQNLNMDVLAERADVIADMDCTYNEKLRGVLLRAGFSEMDPKSEKNLNAHGEFSSVMDWGAAADPEVIRDHIRKHQPAMKNELDDPVFYGAPRLAVQATREGDVAFYVAATKMGSTLERSLDGVAADQRFGAVGLPAMKIPVDRLDAILSHLREEEKKGRDTSRRLTTIQSRDPDGGPAHVLDLESGFDRERDPQEWFTLRVGGDGIYASNPEINMDPAMIASYLEQVKLPPRNSDPVEVKWIRANVRDDQIERLRVVAEDHNQLAWVRRNLASDQRKAAGQLIEAQRQIGGFASLRGLNPYHQKIVEDLNKTLKKGDGTAAGLTLDPVHLERIVTKPLVQAEEVSKMRTGMAFRESFMAAHEISEEQNSLDAMFMYAQHHQAAGVA